MNEARITELRKQNWNSIRMSPLLLGTVGFATAPAFIPFVFGAFTAPAIWRYVALSKVQKREWAVVSTVRPV